jgi:FAD/FMN-containing dehydrogenase
VVWDDKTKFAAGMGAFRKIAELGYQLHGTGMAPTLKVAGYPGSDSGVNPAFRSAVMHCVIYDYAPSSSLPDVTPAADLAGRARLSQATDLLRKVTPGSGAYINEADVLEPNWQQSFFGNNYPKLASIKADWDPWGLFWAPDTPGSENWSVRTADGEPTQNGRLCRTCSRR